MIQTIDHVALLPVYVAAGTALLVFIADLIVPGRVPSVVLGVLGSAAVIPVALLVGDRSTFCSAAGCSYVADSTARTVAVAFAALTVAVILLSARTPPVVPPSVLSPDEGRRVGHPGEYVFLLACSMTGGVVLGYSRDLITLIVALETLTLPLYALVALRRGRKSTEGAVTFFVVSVISTAVTLLGAALLYATLGAVHFESLRDLSPAEPLADITAVAAGLVVIGLGFKVAAVPLHGWAPATYDGSPLPIAGYLSTASKLGGVVALVGVVGALREQQQVVTAVLAGLAVLTMTVGNLGALRQTGMVRLLAWSSIAQAGYVLAALVVSPGAAVAYTIFFVAMEITVFGAVIVYRHGIASRNGIVDRNGEYDGGTIESYRGMARRAPWVAATLVLALSGLAGLPPGLAGLFAKATVIKVLVDAHWYWLAVVVGMNAVLALAYYVRVGALLFAPVGEPVAGNVATGEAEGRGARSSAGRSVVVFGLGLAAAFTLIVGFAPQWVLSAAGY